MKNVYTYFGDDDSLPNLQRKIPSPEAFDLLAEVEPLLALIKSASDSLSSTNVPTLDKVMEWLFKIDFKANELSASADPHAASFGRVVQAELERRYPRFGADNQYYARAHLLHPFYR